MSREHRRGEISSARNEENVPYKTKLRPVAKIQPQGLPLTTKPNILQTLVHCSIKLAAKDVVESLAMYTKLMLGKFST